MELFFYLFLAANFFAFCVGVFLIGCTVLCAFGMMDPAAVSIFHETVRK